MNRHHFGHCHVLVFFLESGCLLMNGLLQYSFLVCFLVAIVLCQQTLRNTLTVLSLHFKHLVLGCSIALHGGETTIEVTFATCCWVHALMNALAGLVSDGWRGKTMEGTLSCQFGLRSWFARLHQSFLRLVLIRKRVVRETRWLGWMEGGLVQTGRGLFRMHTCKVWRLNELIIYYLNNSVKR